MISPTVVCQALRTGNPGLIDAELSRAMAEINAAVQAPTRALTVEEIQTIRESLSSLFEDFSNSSYVRGRWYASIASGLDERETVTALQRTIALRYEGLANAFTVALDERLFAEIQLVRRTSNLQQHAKKYHAGYTGAINARIGKLSTEVKKVRSALDATLEELVRLVDA